MSSAPLAALEQAIALEPENPSRYRALAAELRAGGEEAEAMAAELAATALEARAPLALFNIATACFQTGRRDQAKRWYRLTLRLDPAMVAAHRNLAAILEQEGHLAEAQRHRDEAYGRQSIFVEAAATPTLSVLILAASGYGNVPIDELLPQATMTRIKWFVDYARAEDSDHLPPFDLVFDAAGDPDMTGPRPPVVTEVLQRARKPLLNRPDAVARTRRDQLPVLLAGIADVEVPPVIRVRRTQFGDAALAAHLAFPVIFRPAGAHGGRGVQLLETPAMLAAADWGEAEACYLTRYRDCRSPDRYFRKYRVIFVDRHPYPYHLAISQHWLVHYFSADMLSPSWKRAEEQRFLADPEATLRRKAMAALGAIGRRLDLDFCGIDFALTEDGSIVLFEANATMLVHLRDAPDLFPYKHVYVPRIFDAFATMLRQRLGEADPP